MHKIQKYDDFVNELKMSATDEDSLYKESIELFNKFGTLDLDKGLYTIKKLKETIRFLNQQYSYFDRDKVPVVTDLGLILFEHKVLQFLNKLNFKDWNTPSDRILIKDDNNDPIDTTVFGQMVLHMNEYLGLGIELQHKQYPELRRALIFTKDGNCTMFSSWDTSKINLTNSHFNNGGMITMESTRNNATAIKEWNNNTGTFGDIFWEPGSTIDDIPKDYIKTFNIKT